MDTTLQVPRVRLLTQLLLLWLASVTSAWAGVGPQIVQNGRFAIHPEVNATAYTITAGTDLGNWRSSRPYVNTDTEPARGNVNIQIDNAAYASVTQRTYSDFNPPSAANTVTSTTDANTFLLYRGINASADIWYQNVSVLPNTLYTVTYFASNAAPVGSTGSAPTLQLLATYYNTTGGVQTPLTLSEATNGTTTTIPFEATTDTWTQYSYSFTTGATTSNVELRLRDTQTGTTGAYNQVAITAIVARAISTGGTAISAGSAFSCDGAFYQIRQADNTAINGVAGNSTRLFLVNRGAPPYSTTQLQELGATVNGLSYDPNNGYMYAITYRGNTANSGTAGNSRIGEPSSFIEVVKIGQGGVESIGFAPNLPVAQWAAGAIDRGLNLYIKEQQAGNIIYKLDLNSFPISVTPITLSTSITMFDMAYDPISGLLYGSDYPGNLYSIDPNTGVVNTILTTALTAANADPLGSFFFDVAGNLYAYGNGNLTNTNPGNFYYINKATGVATSIASTVGRSTNSDGASCINPAEQIDVVKQLVSTTNVSSTQRDVTFRLYLRNTGTVTLPNVQVSDFLWTNGTTANSQNVAFPSATAAALQGSVTVTNLDGSTLTGNNTFTGQGTANGAAGITSPSLAALLNTSTPQVLTAGQRVQITYTVRLTFATVPTDVQYNTAYASNSTSTNPGARQLATNGVVLPPDDLTAYDASTNGTTYAPTRIAGPVDSPVPTPVVFFPGITGTVFEDVNYGGGAGRSLATSAGVGRPNVRVELYSNSGAYLSATTTDANGNYAFTNLSANNTYSVRVVNGDVTSSRLGAVAGLLGVQTYRYNDANRVGGEYPARTDAAANTTSATLASLTPNAGTTAAQSIATLTLPNNSASFTSGVDFGFNFDLVVNTNDAGQGSLRQFTINANTLGGEASLAQSGSRVNAAGTTVALPAGKETSIFMIPNGSAVAGLTAYNAGTNPGLISQLTSGVATISQGSFLNLTGTSAATAVYAANTIIDGTTQTANVGNTNAGTATNAAATTVGTDGVALPALQRPEVELLSTGGQTQIAVDANNVTLRGLAVHGGTTRSIRVGQTSASSGYLLENLLVGTTATGVRPTSSISNYGIELMANSGVGTVQNNLVGFTNNTGLRVYNGTATAGTNQILSNFFVGNGFTTGTGDGISFGEVSLAGPANVVGNSIANTNGSGIHFEIGSTSSTTVTNNTITGAGDAGTGSTASAVEGSGIDYVQRTGALTSLSTQADVISKNVITGSQNAGLVIGYGQQNVSISQNSFSGNGVAGTPASTLGIDLIGNANANLYYVGSADANGGANYGNGDGPTANDGNNPATAAATLANRGTDYPVLVTADVDGAGNLIVRGFSRPGAVIEFFIRDNDAGNFGEGQTFIASRTEGNGTDDADATTGAYSGTINGLSQGADAAANRFTFTIPFSSLTLAQRNAILANGLTATATLSNSTSEFSGRVAATTTIAGTIFDDVNYGGGAGRTYATANTSATGSGFANNAIGSAGTTVELYNSAGTFIATTTTTTGGAYSFPGVAAGTYTVRVVNSTVKSVRNNAATGVIGVQTFRTNAGAADANRVGGEYPARVDAAANTGSQTLAALTAGTLAAQSISTVTVASGTPAPVTGIDFGFNFDVISNTNDVGQGSLRQFILNSNALPNTNLNQVPASSGGADPAAGVETSIFMIPDGSADAGLTAYNATTNPGLISQLSGATGGVGGTVAIITPNTATNGALPAITDANTSINALTQFQNIGNNNNVTLGTGGTVGVNATALSQLDGPEVQIVGTPGTTNSEFGLDVRANNTTITGISIYGFGNTQNNTGGGNIRVTSTTGGAALTGVSITGNVIGTSASSFTDPGSTATRSTGNGILLTVGTASTTAPFSVSVTNNLIGYNGTGGIEAIVDGTGNGTTTGLIISGNEIRGNAILANVSDGVRLGLLGGFVRNNLFDSNRGPGIDITGTTATVGGATITNNTINNNGLFGTGQTPGVRVDGANNTITQNIISNNYGAGVMVRSGATNTRISQNSIFGNGANDPDGTGPLVASGQIGIDLQIPADNNGTGTTPYVTLNNASGTTGANGLVNYPILRSATIVGTNLVLRGYSKAGATIELFTAQANPAALNATGANFGQGRTYLTTVTEGVSDADAGTSNYSGNINGFAQGSDTGASNFTFTIPLSSLTGVAAGSLLTSTATLSGATSEFSGNVTVNSAPIAQNVTNVGIASTSGAVQLSPGLSGTPSGTATIASYTIASLPTSGTLTYNGTVLTAGNIATTSITDLTLLTYTPVSSFTGNATFTYTVTDSNGITSTTNRTGTGAATAGAATYTIPVTQVTIAGTVYNDVNGLVGGGTIDGTATGTFGSPAVQTYVSLVNSATNAIVNTQTVAANGTYTFNAASGVVAGTSYNLVLTTASAGATTATAPTGYGFTGEGTTAAGDGNPNGIIVLGAVNAPVTTANFGVERLPTAGTATQTATNPGGTTSIAILGTNFSGTDVDPNVTTPAGAISSLLITALPAGATSITINGTTYSSTAALGTGVSVTTNANGSLATGQSISIDPQNGAQTIVLNYTTVDNGGLRSASPGTVTLTVSDLTIAGTVYNDVNGLVGSGTIDGLATGTPGGTQAYVSLVSGTTVVATATVAANGTYSFGTAQGLLSGTSYNLVLTTASAGSTTASTTTGYGFIGEGTAAAGDGNPNGIIVLGAVSANVSGANFGVEKRPLAGTNTATSPDPGGTTQVTVAATGFTGTDTDAQVTTPAGAITSLTLTSFPTNATTVVINGVSFTNATFATATVPQRTLTTAANGNLASGQTLTVDPAGPGDVVFSYSVLDNGGLSSTTDGTLTLTITPVADVATTITPSPSPVNAGGTLTFNVTFTNAGPNTAAGYTRTLTLPAGLGTGVTITGATYNNATGAVTFTTPPTTLASGANANVTVTIPNVPASFTSITASTTTGTSTSQGADTGANSATSTVTVTPVADVYSNLTGPGSLSAGIQSGNYSVTFGNSGPSTAAGVTRTVTIPANTVSAVNAPGATVTGTAATGFTLTYPGGTFNSGTSDNYTFTVTPGLLTAGTDIAITSNTSTTTSQNGATGNDASTVTYTVGAIADVTTTLTAPATLLAGVQSGNYTVTFANNGPSTASTVTRVVTIPGGVASAVSAPGATVTGDATNGWTLTYPGGTFANGNSVSYNFTLTPTAAAAGNNLTVTSTTGTTTPQGANLGPDVATTSTAVVPVADVLTTITGPTTIAQGQATGNYTATFTNNGPNTAASVTRTVTLPAGASLTTAQQNTITTAYPGTTFSTTGSGATAVTTINFGTQTSVASGASSSFVFAFTAPSTSGATSIASNTSTTTSQNGATANDAFTLNLTVSPVADVTTTLNGPTQLSTGQPSGTYTVTYANVGTAAAGTVTRTVTLPAGATNIVATGGTITGTTIDFGNVTSLAAGASSSFTFSFTAPPTAGAVTVVSNTSTVTSEGTNPAPNSSTINATVNAVADVVATIAPITGTVAAGSTGVGFNVSFSNNGALTPAAGVTRTVQLPAGLGTVTATNGGTYNNTTGLVTYTPSPTTIANGTPLTSVITFTAPASGPVTATANVSTTSNEAGQTANNTQSATLNINPAFDLATTIYGPATVLQGNQVTLNVTTTNNGPSATTATQTVQLIAGLQNVFVSNGGTYNSANGVVSFPAIASLPSGQTVANTISFTAPVSGTALAPVATVTPNTVGAGETNTANNTAYLNGAASSTNITINAPTTQLANVYTTVSATPQAVAAGSTVTVTVTQGNAGPSAAANVVETVQLLPGLTITTLPSGATYNTTTGLLTLPTIASQASGASTSYTIAFTAPANAGNNGQLLISASATTQTSETVVADNVASTVVTVTPTADVATFVSGPANASAGQTVTYTASFANNGQGTATGVVRTVQLPAGLGTVTILNAATGAAAGTYDSATGLVTFPALTTQAAGTSTAYTLSFAAPAANYTVRSATSATTVDGTMTNNASSVSTTVAGAADVAVAISGPASAVVGNPVTYYVTTTNNGPSGATGVAATLTMPTGLTTLTVNNQTATGPTGGVYSYADGSTYNSTTGVVSFAAIGALTSGASVANYVTFAMPSATGGQITGVASVTSTSTDPIGANNSASTATSVAPVTGTIADVATTVSAPASATAGASMTVTAIFTNNGPAAAINVAPTAQLPAGLTGVVVSNSGTYNAATGVVTWPLIASQASGNTATYTVAFTAPATGPVRASTAVSSQTSDNVATNNSATTTTTITTSYDAVTSLSGPASSLPGVTNTYTVTAANNGPSVAPSVTQTVTLPAGVTASNISGGGTQTGTTITWPALTNLAPGAANAVSYTFDVTMPATGNLALNASVSTGAGESNTGNNTATLTTTRANQPPVASNVVNSLQSPEGNTAGQLLISPLAATDADGTIASYQLTSIPDATTQGTLYYNNGGTYTALTAANLVGGGSVVNLTPTQAATLRFDPVSTFAGNVFFNYTATDNLGGVSNVALYTIPVSNDIPALYTVAPVKGGTTNPYNNGDVLATVFDANGGTYTSAGVVNFNGLVSAVLNSGPLPAGTALNPVTGQITVTDRSQLVPGIYSLTITTTDVYGGVTVHDIKITIGGSPIAVDDFATTNLNTAVTFAVAANDLANGGEPIDANSIDLDPNTAGIQTSITTALGTFTTVGAPTGSVTFTPASPTFTGTATTPYVISNTAVPTAVSNQANLVVTVRGNLPVDLATTISASANPVNAGASETLTVTATNNGTTTATGVVQTVSIPSGLTAATLTIGGQTGTPSGNIISFANGASYNTTTGLVTFATQSLNAGATQTFPLVTFPAPAASFTATAQVGNGTTDPTPANNVQSVNVTVTPQFDLTTSLSGPATVVTGDLATFTVVSRNNGPSAVSNAVQTVQLPTGLTGVFITGGGTYNSVNGVVTFPAVALAAGQTTTNSISFAPTANFSPSALITPNTTPAGETNIGNNTGYLNGAGSLTAVTVTPATTNRANVYVTVTGPATVNPGASATYTVTQGNNGPNTAANVVTSVSLPTGLTTATLTIGGVTGTQTGNTITFGTGGPQYDTQTGVVTFPTLTTQGSAATPQSYSIVLTAPAAGTYNVTANVATATTDPVPGDNVASVMTNIAPSADVATAISGPASATAGQPVTFTVTSTNNSGVAATGVAQTVNLPAGLLATDLRVGGSTGTLSGTTITFPNGATYNVNTGVLTLATIATLPANGSQSTAIAFTAPGTTGSLSLTAASSTTSYDGVPANNRSTITTTLTTNSDVVVAVAGPASVTTGNPVTYTVTTTNNGPSVAGSQTTTVQLPTGLTGVVVRDNTGAIVSGAYNATTGVVTFAAVTNQLPGQANAQTGTITFLAPNTPRLDVAAIASVPGTNGDPNLDNNRATAVTSVTPASATTADVAVSLTPNVTTQTAGAPVVYTLTTQNNTAANPATNVVRTVSLPAGLTTTTLSLNGTTSTSTANGIITFTGGPNNGATYNTATGVLTLPTLASLVNGTPVTTTITVTPANGPLVASATAAGANTDPNTANNSAQATNVVITPSTDVATYLSAPASAAAGSTVTYTVVTANNGPSNVSSLVQTVTLPTGATGISAPVGATVSGTTVTYTVSNLTAGSSQTNAISFTMPNVASAAGSASVPTTNDPATGNNTSNVTTTRPNQAPVAQDVVNTLQSPEGNTANAPLPISPLAGSDADGSVASYQLLSIPTTTQGVLYYDNGGTYTAITAANFATLVLTPTQAGTLRFDPAATFAGTVSFTYQATDNLGATSNVGTYSIQSGIDNASVYATTPVKTNTNTNPYATGNIIAYVIDPNGAAYNSAGAIYNADGTLVTAGAPRNGLATTGTNAILTPVGNGAGQAPAPSGNPTNTLPAGLSLNPTTGQIFVSNAALLANPPTATTYTVNITTTDVFGGVTTQPVSFTIGAFPLPVELTVFTAKAVKLDGVLSWTTASEKNNDHFEVERSLNGREFTKIGTVQGQGSKATPTDYTLTDAGIGARVSGPVYYRLKQVDVDGTSSYSPVRTIAFTKPVTPTMSLYPNPATSATELDLTQVPTGTYTVSIIDATGRVIVGLTTNGALTQRVNLSEVASGTYTVLLRGTTAEGTTLTLTKRLLKN